MTPRVLIADDDVVVRDVVRRYLERDGLESRWPVTAARHCECWAPNGSTWLCST